jgi:hypothetical protein
MKLRATRALYNVMKPMMAHKLEWEISKGAFPPHQIIRMPNSQHCKKLLMFGLFDFQPAFLIHRYPNWLSKEVNSILVFRGRKVP